MQLSDFKQRSTGSDPHFEKIILVAKWREKCRQGDKLGSCIAPGKMTTVWIRVVNGIIEGSE